MYSTTFITHPFAYRISNVFPSERISTEWLIAERELLTALITTIEKEHPHFRPFPYDVMLYELYVNLSLIKNVSELRQYADRFNDKGNILEEVWSAVSLFDYSVDKDLQANLIPYLSHKIQRILENGLKLDIFDF